MTAFATADDLAARLGLTFTDDEATRATTLLELATGLIQDEAEQTISLVSGDVLTMPGTTDDLIKLPQRPVVSVSSVTLDGLSLTEGTYWYLEGDAIARLPSSAVFLTGGQVFNFPAGSGSPYSGFGWPAQTLAITYSHGYADDEIPQSIKAICMEAVVRVFANPNSIARETIAGVQTVYDNMRFSPSGLLLTDAEIRVVRRMFGRAAGSITVGR